MNYDGKIDSDQEAVGRAAGTSAELMEENRPISRKMLIIGLTILAVLVGLWILDRINKPEELGAERPAQAPVVSVVVPGRATVAADISATGTLAARRELPVGSVGDGGRVVRVLVEPGDWVRAGQVLAVIDRAVQNEQAASQEAQVSVAQADARLAQANLDRALKLVDRGFISKADVDRLTATRDAAVARVRVARAQLGETRARNDRLNIVSPAAGLVLERNVEPGQVVGPSSEVLFRIAQDGEMELLALLSEDDLARISVGAPAKVTPVGTQETFTGHVWQISPVIDPTKRQGTARIALAYNRALRPGGFARAQIAAGSLVAPKLPESAILSDDNGSYVYIVGKDRKVVRRNVKTGPVSADGVTVLEGLNGTEQVVLRAGAFLSPGETVQVRRVKGT